MQEVTVIQDSISKAGVRLTTLQLRFPRFLLPEFNTHRVFSRNASSSRAIPVAKLAQLSLDTMYEPLFYGLNQPGMQSKEESLTGEALEEAKAIWRNMAETCVAGATRLAELGLHKQWSNRPVEWLGHIQVIVTATEWNNFMELRDHADAQPEIRVLAAEIKRQMYMSAPVVRERNRLHESGWHLPYVTQDERRRYADEPLFLAKLSSARCARVSYLLTDGTVPSAEKDIALYDRLVGSRPLHASPVEHSAYPLPLPTQRSNNFVGWRQYRELVEASFH